MKLLFFLLPAAFIKNEYSLQSRGEKLSSTTRREDYSKNLNVKTTIVINKDFVSPSSFFFLTEICLIKQISSYGSCQLTKAEAKKKGKLRLKEDL